MSRGAADTSGRLDVGALRRRMQAHGAEHVIRAFEQGRVVERDYATVCLDVDRAAARLRAAGVRAGMRVGIRAPSSYHWIVHDLALLELRAVSVAFTDDVAEVDARDLMARYRLSLMLVAERERDRAAGAGNAVAFIDSDREWTCRVLLAEAQSDAWDHPWLIFSSGSAGGVKGLVLNRRGVEESIHALVEAMAPRRDDRLLLFLPMSNFQQRMMYYGALWYGVDLIVADILHLFQALTLEHPTILIAPPALYETFETRIDSLRGWKRTAFAAAAAAVWLMPVDALRRRAARVLFRDVYRALGGQMRMMITGMAPIKRSTLELFARMQLPLFETYGLIEAGPLTLNVPGANRIGSVGRPLRGVRLEIAADGEIIVNRPHRTASCYFEAAPGESEQTFLDATRVATGDVGFIDEDGFVHLVGRKKEVIVSRGGEKIHPEAVEAEIHICPDVDRAVVLDNDGLGLVAIVRQKQPGDEAARARIGRFIEGVGERHPRFVFTTVLFTEMPFTRENGFLRPNLKLDRRRIAAHFQPASVVAASGR